MPFGIYSIFIGKQYSTIVSETLVTAATLFKISKNSILDTQTGLTWRKNSTELNMCTKFDEIEGSKVEGSLEDWRLPTREEVETLLKGMGDPIKILRFCGFKVAQHIWFWTSSKVEEFVYGFYFGAEEVKFSRIPKSNQLCPWMVK